MLKKIFIILLLITFSLPALAKFTSPFSGTLLPENTKAAVGKIVNFILTLETTDKIGTAEVSLKLPKGLELVKGEKVLSVSDLVPGGKKKIYYQIRIIEKGEQQVMISVKSKDIAEGLSQSKVFISLINPLPVKDTGTHTVDSDGTRAFVK